MKLRANSIGDEISDTNSLSDTHFSEIVSFESKAYFAFFREIDWWYRLAMWRLHNMFLLLFEDRPQNLTRLGCPAQFMNVFHLFDYYSLESFICGDGPLVLEV